MHVCQHALVCRGRGRRHCLSLSIHMITESRNQNGSRHMMPTATGHPCWRQRRRHDPRQVAVLHLRRLPARQRDPVAVRLQEIRQQGDGEEQAPELHHVRGARLGKPSERGARREHAGSGGVPARRQQGGTSHRRPRTTPLSGQLLRQLHWTGHSGERSAEEGPATAERSNDREHTTATATTRSAPLSRNAWRKRKRSEGRKAWAEGQPAQN